MEFDPALILFIIFILAPLLERLLKGNKQPPPPPPPSRPHQRMPQQGPRPDVERPEPTTSQQQGREPSAAEMVPDDLWAILTGEQRPRTPTEPPQQERPLPPAQEPRRQPLPSRPTPAPAPTSQRPAPVARRPRPPEATPPVPQRRPPPVVQRPTPAGYDMRGELPPDEEAIFRRPPPPERYPVEGYVREIPKHAPPEIVSLEELVIDDVKRHESFHDRLAALPRAERVHHDKLHALSQRFREPDELRRAIVMSEVLGRPKALD